MDTAEDPHVVTMEAKFRVNPKRMSAMELRATPAAMYGLLRPKRDLELSAMTPVPLSAKDGDGERRETDRADQ